MNLVIQTPLQIWMKVLEISRQLTASSVVPVSFLVDGIWWSYTTSIFFSTLVYDDVASSIHPLIVYVWLVNLFGVPKTWTKTWAGDMDGHLMLLWSCLDLFLGDFLLQFEPILTMTLAHDFDPTTCLTKTRALLQFCKSCYQHFGFHFCWTWSNIAFWNVG